MNDGHVRVRSVDALRASCSSGVSGLCSGQVGGKQLESRSGGPVSCPARDRLLPSRPHQANQEFCSGRSSGRPLNQLDHLPATERRLDGGGFNEVSYLLVRSNERFNFSAEGAVAAHASSRKLPAGEARAQEQLKDGADLLPTLRLH